MKTITLKLVGLHYRPNEGDQPWICYDALKEILKSNGSPSVGSSITIMVSDIQECEDFVKVIKSKYGYLLYMLLISKNPHMLFMPFAEWLPDGNFWIGLIDDPKDR